MEAAVTLFSKSGNLGGKVRRMGSFDPSYSLGSQTAKEFNETYLNELSEKLVGSIPIKEVEVLRVHKRFLHPEEKPQNTSRLIDLFRVVYKVDPSKLVEQQKGDNPEAFQNFDENMLKSLEGHMESFEDFDMVVDARGTGESPLKLGPGGSPALNENLLKEKGHIYYGWEAAEFLNGNPGNGHMVIGGEGEPAALAVLRLKDWIIESGNNLTLVCEKDHPFKNLSPDVQSKIDEFMGEQENIFMKKMEEYREKLFSWRELEDYIKAKTPMPAEPRPPFDVLIETYITSVDRLLDAEGWFLTCESPGNEQIKTLKADTILALKGYRKETSLSEDLQTDYNYSRMSASNPVGIHPEPGFYTLGAHDYETGHSKIEPIIENMLSFFTKVED